MTDQVELSEILEVGPFVPSLGGISYQVTLESGAIATSPIAFLSARPPHTHGVVVTADGQVVSIPVISERSPMQAEFEELMRRVLGIDNH